MKNMRDSSKEERYTAICENMDEPGGHYVH